MSEKFKQVCIRLPVELHEKIRAYNEASETEINMNKVCVNALQDVIKRCGK